MDTRKEQRHVVQHEGNKIKVSGMRQAKFVVGDAKELLQQFETVELHALGNAVMNSITAGENLVK